MAPISTSKYRSIAVAAVVVALLLPAAASATDPTPDPAEPSLTGSGAIDIGAPMRGASVSPARFQIL
jgi:hypothetical protein